MKFLNQRKDGAVVSTQQLFEMFAAFGPYCLLWLGDSTGAGKGFVDLVIQIIAIGDNYKGPVAGDFAQHLLSKEDHGETFAAALRMPENTQASLVLTNAVDGFKGVIDTQVLVILRDNLPEITPSIAK